MTEYDFGPGLRLEQRIDAHEADAITDRWEFGRWMLSHVPNGQKKLPVGFLGALAKATGKSQRELQYRRQCAERYPNVDAIAKCIAQCGSWFAVVTEALTERPETTQADPGPLPAGTFRTVVADPPWQYGNAATRGAAEDHYPTMAVEELCELPVGDVAGDDAHLYLWVTNNFIREAFDVIDAWGFDYKTCLTWVKPQIGMGNYFRSVTEHILFGVCGGLRTQARDIRNCIEAPRQKHSAKPHSFYELVEKASPGPYLEMFARPGPDALFASRTGEWTYWGNEARGSLELAAA